MYDFSSCEWSPVSYFFISDNVFGTLIYYSHLSALVLALLLGYFIFKQDTRKLLNRLLLSITLFLGLWIFFDLILWATDKPSHTMFFWSLINMVEPIIYAVSFYFVYVFIKEKDLSFKKKIFTLIPLLPTILLTPTMYAINGFNFSNCDREAVEGPLVYYGYGIEILYVLLILVVAIYNFRKTSDKNTRSKIALITTGICLFLFSFAYGNIIGSIAVDWTIGQYGLIGIPFFVGFLSYLIIKYKSFDAKILSAQLLVTISWVLVCSLLFIRNIQNIRVVVIFTLVLLAIIGYIVIQGVKKEVKQKEHLEELSNKLADANVKLQDVDKLKTEFLSLASHQLRSPLTAIKGYTSMLLEGSFGTITKEQTEAVDRVYQSSKHLAMVVEDLLNVSKIEQGGMKYVMDPFDIRKQAYELAMDLKVTAEKKGLVLTFVSDSELPHTVYGDMEKIRQVLLNFIDNSVKYTEKGSIEVSVKTIVKAGKNVVRFAVKDTGMGISPETKAKLFQKFSRGEGGKINTGGSGLGLYLAKEIAAAHKGMVDVESEGMGKGSTFVLEMEEYKEAQKI